MFYGCICNVCGSRNAGAYVYMGHDEWTCFNCKYPSEEKMLRIKHMSDIEPVTAPLGYAYVPIAGRVFIDESTAAAYADMIFERLGIL